MTATVNATSQLSIDVGRGSSLTVGGGSGTLTNNNIVQVVAGASPADNSTYNPISAAWAGSGTVQPVGGTWSSGTNQFTVSAASSGTPGTPLGDGHFRQSAGRG